MAVVAVEVDDAMDGVAVVGATREEAEDSPPVDAIETEPVPCWGRTSVEDEWLELDDGGDGKRDAPPSVDSCCDVAKFMESWVSGRVGALSAICPGHRAGLGVCVVVTVCVCCGGCEASASLTVARERLAERLR
jgi:hypothetical protein